jgi:hypothetical protein
VKAAMKQTVNDGFILAEDAPGTIDQADRSTIGYGYPCGPECRATQTLRVLTDGSLIPNGDKLLRSLDEAMLALASGDSQAKPSRQVQDYDTALQALAKYVDDLQKLAAKRQVPPTIAVDLNDAAAALISG